LPVGLLSSYLFEDFDPEDFDPDDLLVPDDLEDASVVPLLLEVVDLFASVLPVVEEDLDSPFEP
jgi:hypothetical protein